MAWNNPNIIPNAPIHLKVVNKTKKVIFCLPGGPFSPTFLGNWTQLIMGLRENYIDPKFSQAQDAVVYYVRNKVLGGDVLRGPQQKPFNGMIPYDYLMWIDSDIVFRPEHFYSLLKHQKDIIAGLYMMKGGDAFAVVEQWDEEFFKKRGAFQFMTPKDVERKRGLFEVDYTGFGFMLIKYGVFESLEYPWFQPLWHEIGTARDFSSEDVAFCKLAKRKGFKIYIDPTVRVGHEKSCIY